MLRYICCRSPLKRLLCCLKLGAVRWLSTTLSIISNYSEILACRIDALENLHLMLELCEERVKFHVDIIYEMLVRLLYDLSKIRDDEKSPEQQKCFDLAAEALNKAAQASPEEFRQQFGDNNEIVVNENFDRVISGALQSL